MFKDFPNTNSALEHYLQIRVISYLKHYIKKKKKKRKSIIHNSMTNSTQNNRENKMHSSFLLEYIYFHFIIAETFSIL